MNKNLEDMLKDVEHFYEAMKAIVEEAKKQEGERIAEEMGKILEPKNSDYHSKCCGMIELWQTLKEEK